MILSAQSIREADIIRPFHESTDANGLSYGLGPASYDIRLDQNVTISPKGFALCSSMEQFTMPDDVLGVVHDKSTWVRKGICVQNTIIDPGWHGYLTIELTNHGLSPTSRLILAGSPIAQIVFHRLDENTTIPYSGKYQYQERGPQEAR